MEKEYERPLAHTCIMQANAVDLDVVFMERRTRALRSGWTRQTRNQQARDYCNVCHSLFAHDSTSRCWLRNKQLYEVATAKVRQGAFRRCAFTASAVEAHANWI